MVPLPVAPDVWRITTPLPFRPRTVHAYLVALDGSGWMLVDGGLGTAEAWSVLDAGVRAVAGGWRTLALHLVTHMHVDHVGLAGRVRGASGAPLAMGALDAERSDHAAAEPGEEAGYRESLLREHGVPRDARAEIQGAAGSGAARPGHVPADLRVPAAATELARAPGWTALWTPGHTAGHLSLLRPADGVLIAGDAVLPRVTPTIGVNRQRPDPVGDYLGTLAGLAERAPRLALPGHGDPVEDVAGRLDELRSHTRRETERVAALLTPDPATAWEVALRRYAGRDLPPSARFQALRETLAHLHFLAARSRALREGDADGTTRFRAA